MNREELIKKWLDNNLNAEEQKAFEQLEDYSDLIRMNSALQGFKSPNFSVDKHYNELKPKLKSNNNKLQPWYKPLLRVAAILAICFSAYYYTTTLDTEVNTLIAKQTNIELPDASEVMLNANSSLVFNESQWNKNREVKLNGEAFFKVAKGKKFDVITDNGVVSVLGTQFNVKQRNDYFEVTCFEGLVGVKFNEEFAKLKPGHSIKVIDGKLLANEKELTAQPIWLRGESSFKNTPLKHVIAELENYYDIDVVIDKADASRLFSGSFTHKNLDLALQSVTIPLNLSYSKSGTSIVLKRE
ncbi:FecR family protein [Winogradskyella sp.]|jgi:ferric-dicitrate binding protein FerR (iron transport regulator)|uniref:FecR family protein n=1 Tax=Winogradskyella sp. TaxID=1883156 RepID=UPI0025F08A1A|nr:FecR domain-containing protein [Winogradskyella sp.]MCT4630946.1 FecR domain-containing protein [Winogradskyella sp.]